MRKSIFPVVAAAITVSSFLAATDPSLARSHHHHHNTGAAIAGGIAAGVIGGLVGGSIANSQEQRYVDPPPPRCWHEDRRVQNQYDGDWHIESVRVCE
ncbi:MULTISPECIES: hypothetical protein [unclassified Rhizobium]|uniref:hypothetical protein n=1 Tax=unclassified Rhizobium TaxID=2613769 RepID=UPI0016153FF6|nr:MULTISPECIES: hypothetical protein [unclassified Rhizobium]MBB3543096.1 hypothetical protein [Rhizobium sp. BK399]MCS3742311.1 hypothetical protein [Rhizobium sp. BK661]